MGTTSTGFATPVSVATSHTQFLRNPQTHNTDGTKQSGSRKSFSGIITTTASNHTTTQNPRSIVRIQDSGPVSTLSPRYFARSWTARRSLSSRQNASDDDASLNASFSSAASCLPRRSADEYSSPFIASRVKVKQRRACVIQAGFWAIKQQTTSNQKYSSIPVQTPPPSSIDRQKRFSRCGTRCVDASPTRVSHLRHADTVPPAVDCAAQQTQPVGNCLRMVCPKRHRVP